MGDAGAHPQRHSRRHGAAAGDDPGGAAGARGAAQAGGAQALHLRCGSQRHGRGAGEGEPVVGCLYAGRAAELSRPPSQAGQQPDRQPDWGCAGGVGGQTAAQPLCQQQVCRRDAGDRPDAPGELSERQHRAAGRLQPQRLPQRGGLSGALQAHPRCLHLALVWQPADQEWVRPHAGVLAA